MVISLGVSLFGWSGILLLPFWGKKDTAGLSAKKHTKA